MANPALRGRMAGADLELGPAEAEAIYKSRGYGQAVDELLADDSKREWWNEFARWLVIGQKKGQKAPKWRGIDLEPSNFGSTLLPPEHSRDVWDLLLTYGAFRTLGFRKAPQTQTKYATITALPTTIWTMPNQSPPAVTPDVSFSGTSVSPEHNLLAALLNVSLQLMEDAAVDIGRVLLETLSKAIAAGIDYAAFQGNGNADTINGGQTGIFNDANIQTATAGAGGTSIAQLSRMDLLNVVGTVTPAALQRQPRWWIHPSFLPQFAIVRDGVGDVYCLQGPDRTDGRGWYLVGFPVTWTAQAPSASSPGSKVAAFGEPDSYLVSVRRDVAVAASYEAPAAWPSLSYQWRAFAEVLCQTRQANGLATLTLAKS